MDNAAGETEMARDMEVKFGIFDLNNAYDPMPIMTVYAANNQAALDKYAGERSGYETFSEMVCSLTFGRFTNVYASRLTA